MAEVEFSNAAVADLVEIDAFSVVRFGEEITKIYMNGFDSAFERLRDKPLSAPLRPEYGGGVRCLVHRQHRVLYVGDKDYVLIARILHHSRDVRRALKETAK